MIMSISNFHFCHVYIILIFRTWWLEQSCFLVAKSTSMCAALGHHRCPCCSIVMPCIERDAVISLGVEFTSLVNIDEWTEHMNWKVQSKPSKSMNFTRHFYNTSAALFNPLKSKTEIISNSSKTSYTLAAELNLMRSLTDFDNTIFKSFHGLIRTQIYGLQWQKLFVYSLIE